MKKFCSPQCAIRTPQSEIRNRKAWIYTLGCRLNQAETVIISERLQEAGYELVPFGEPANLGIINTCTVTAEADAKSRKMIRAFLRKNPEAFVAVIGCYAQLAHETIAQIEGVDLIVGNRRKLDFLDYVTEGKNATPVVVRDRLCGDDFSIRVACAPNQKRRANLKIQDGCSFGCSYCVVPAARGAARSRDLGNLLEEARQRVACGVKEIVLSGVNVGSYDFGGHTVVDVVDHLNEIEGLLRIRISSIELTTIRAELLERMNAPGHVLVPHLHIPLQSGSNKVLALMNRKYTSGQFMSFITKAHRAVRDLCIGVDVLAGMPGETDDDFQETCRLLFEGPIAYAHVFKYSERKGAPAEKLDGKVDPKTRKERSKRALEIGAEKRRQYCEGFLGRRLEVLFEQQEAGYWRGYTGNYIRVAVRSHKDLENALRTVRLEEVRDGLAFGSLVDIIPCAGGIKEEGYESDNSCPGP